MDKMELRKTMSRSPRKPDGFADETMTVPSERRSASSLDVESGDEVEIGFSRTGPCRIVSGTVSVVYNDQKFAVCTGDSPIRDLTYMVDGRELRSGTFDDAIDEEEGRVSFVAKLD